MGLSKLSRPPTSPTHTPVGAKNRENLFPWTMDSKLAIAGAVGGLVGGLVGAVAVTLATRGRRSSIRRLHTGDPRSSGVLVHRDIVYLSGQVGIIENIDTSDVVQQTQETLAKIEKLLADVGTNKSNILEARIWLKDIKRDFAPMNGVWKAIWPEKTFWWKFKSLPPFESNSYLEQWEIYI